MFNHNIKKIHKHWFELSACGLILTTYAVCMHRYAPGIANASDNKYYGAIAVGDHGRWGTSNNRSNRDAAYDHALDMCKEVDKGCEVLVQFSNGCGAVVYNRSGWHGGYGSTRNSAIRHARNGYGGRIIVVRCTDSDD